MNKKAQWILEEAEISGLEGQRVRQYRQLEYPVGEDKVFNQGYISAIANASICNRERVNVVVPAVVRAMPYDRPWKPGWTVIIQG